jgi:hypothetical protein
VLVVSFGVLGSDRAQRTVLDPLAVQWLGSQSTTVVRIVAIVAGLALFVGGMWWLVRSLRPDSRVLARARESLGVVTLPTAVRLELDSEAIQRVR